MEKERHQEEQEKKQPHFSNLNEDPALMGKLTHMCKPGRVTIGCGL